MRKTVCIDLDGVLADYRDGFQGISRIGDPIPGAKEFVDEIAKFADVLIFTCRCSPEVAGARVSIASCAVETWLNDHNIYFDDIYIGAGKPVAAAYVDDRAVSCDPQAFFSDKTTSSAFDMAVLRCQVLAGVSRTADMEKRLADQQADIAQQHKELIDARGDSKVDNA